MLNLCGPRSRDVLAQLTDAPLDNASFPYMSARELDVGYAPVLALRVTYLGELGYELHVPVEYALQLYERLWAAGERYGIANAGYRVDQQPAPREALSRLGLGYHAAITIRYEAGLGFCVAADKGEFLARAALAEVKARGPKRKLAWFTAPPELNLFGGEIVLAGDRVLGRVTSGGYGYTVGRNIFCAYVAADEPVAARIRDRGDGRALSARFATREPLYDPDRRAILRLSTDPHLATVVPWTLNADPLSLRPPSSTRCSRRAATATACRARSITTTRCTPRRCATIWQGGWLFAGFAFEIPKPGDFLTLDGRRFVGTGDPRRRRRSVRAFHNVCRHRGTQLCRKESGHVRAHRLPVSQLDVFAAGRARSRARACTTASTSRSSV